MCCGCLFFVSLPHGAMGWSAVCDCGISWSYSLFIGICPFFIGPEKQIFSVKLTFFFLSINQNIEQSHQDGSFEYPQHIFWLRNNKINPISGLLELPPSPTMYLVIWNYPPLSEGPLPVTELVHSLWSTLGVTSRMH